MRQKFDAGEDPLNPEAQQQGGKKKKACLKFLTKCFFFLKFSRIF